MPMVANSAPVGTKARPLAVGTTLAALLFVREGASIEDYKSIKANILIPGEGIVSKRLGSIYRRGRSQHWVKVKNPKAPAVKREAEEDWGR